MRRLSLAHFRIAASLVLFAGLSLTAYWVAAGRGPYPFFLALELGEGPATHPLAAAGLTFIVTMLPCLALCFGLAWRSPAMDDLRSLRLATVRAELSAALSGHVKDREQSRAARAFGIAASGSVVGAGIRQGWFEAWFGDPGSLTISVVLALVFGVVAGIIHGRTALARVGFSVALGGVALGALPAVEWYLERRPEPLLFELLLPIAAGGLPGTIVFLGVSAVVKRFERPGAG